MLHVILQILAVIGIILLCILGLIILLLLLILFVPIRYRVRGSKNEEVILLRVRISYLLHLLSLRYDYPKPGKVVVRLLGIPIYDSEKKARGKSNKEDTAGKDDAVNAPSESAEHNQAPVDTGIAEEVKETNDMFTAQSGEPKESSEETENTDYADKTQSAEPVKEPIKFLRHPIKWIKEKLRKLKYTICSIYDNIKNVWNKIKHFFDNISYYKDIITDTENQQLFGRVKNRAFKVLKSIRPRVLHANIHIGTGSPDTTGYLCGLYGMLSPILGNNVSIEADFEKAVLEGNVYVKGRITLFTILLQAGKILLDKQLRIFIKQLKREEI